MAFPLDQMFREIFSSETPFLAFSDLSVNSEVENFPFWSKFAKNIRLKIYEEKL